MESMKRTGIALVAVLLVGSLLPAAAAELGQLTYMTGWVVDEDCGKKNASEEGKDCIIECHKNGSPLVFYNKEKDTTWVLVDQKRAEKYIGREMTVLGYITDDGALKISSYVEKGTKNSVVGPPMPEPEEDGSSGSDGT